MFGLSPAQMIILLVVILLVFGTKKLRNAGSDLGAAVKGFKKAMQDDEKTKDAEFKSIDNNATSAKTETTKEKEQA
ncbi:twin-arginine translocase TatA/TatE family subunit [Haemophilus haemolyticus]|uniref:Sec-independent protein translocase protein TatA n=1 Tax=Haemophilus haemolyticus M19501 TaxID=1028803 RepID=F9GMV9_HAEHA|nr:twin-arginine translocase TatA/TatE family subunit [Haemophilus haemolyticus]EGT76538.1 Sec-independent protein translocase protein tatA/E [Haemophilus haemolyticus M19501]